MYRKYTIVFLVALIPGFASGQAGTAYQCSLDGMQRRIEILTEPGVTVPCEVHYYKDTEMPGENQVLWRATNEAGYCESKAEDFVATLRDTGWDCVPGGASEPAPESAAEPVSEPVSEPEYEPEYEPEPITDDTDALEPAQ